jgi:hypothetical protein
VTVEARRPPLDLRRSLVVALVGWLWARICVALGFWLAHLLTPDPSLSGREDFPLPRALLSWDSHFYDLIARGGYQAVAADGARFFPLYPLLGRWLSPLFGGRDDVALVVIGNLAALAGAVLLAQLAREVLADRWGADEADAVGLRSAWMVAIVPAAIVFVWPYTEGLALVATAGTLLALHRRNWWAVAGFALLAGALRPTGLLLCVPIVIELVLALRSRTSPRPKALPAVAALAAAPLGLVASVAFIARTTGDWMSAWEQQRPIRGDFRNPLVRAAESLWGLVHNTDTELVPFVVLWVVLVIVAVRRRQPWSWIAFSVVTLLVALAAQTIDSIGRYGLLAVPLVVALAQWSDRRWKEVLVACVGSAGLVVWTAQALQGRIVP